MQKILFFFIRGKKCDALGFILLFVRQVDMFSEG